MNCWRIKIYFTKSRFSLNGGYIVYMEPLSGHEKIITKSGISLNAGTLNQDFTVSHKLHDFRKRVTEHKMRLSIFSTTFVWNIPHFKKNSAIYYHKCTYVFM
jgi:hypothetical protein